mmetsp:Transcript_22533/g.31358  ORF Transcript_22533/g.31358 Transcript_22533/m.31358 type:complete len:418 (-) Transcript_22533:180-1433(-)|eukprot:CAMPEP_0196579516 /NCGR_PEP_ID=MMETSP1081-20130531/22112_1 /TAXON_ID=36882 /ORGANISM="Pyramimonas amylifera, Strain CCMP720" /LENGTH=417 /DNA_ID=CAMNT_0041899135 /DNA_START=108 /DNA_END=1361 /DNA_ORIENTATION=+
MHSRTSTPVNDPRYDTRWKMPGYTGHVNSIYETIGSTPVVAQRKAFFRNGTEMDPTAVEHVKEPHRDPCNKVEGLCATHGPEVLWPQLAAPGEMRRKGENGSSLILGDRRYIQPFTHYKDIHVHPQLQSSLWKPAQNIKDHPFQLAAMEPEERAMIYEKMLAKVGETRLLHLEDNLRLRFAAKLNTASNCNGFKLIKLFQNFDVDKTGTLEIHEFRKAMNSYGLQLPEEAEIAMFAKFDVDNNGTLDYKEFIAHFVDPEYLDLGFSSLKSQTDRVAERQQTMDHSVALAQKKLKDRFQQLTSTNSGTMTKDIFRRMDVNKNGVVSREEFGAGMSSLNVEFSDMELDHIFLKFDPNGNGLSYAEFVDAFCPKFTDYTLGRSSFQGAAERHFVDTKAFTVNPNSNTQKFMVENEGAMRR